MNQFYPDHTHFEQVVSNRRPDRLPLYEHIISPSVMEVILDEPFAPLGLGSGKELERFFYHYCRFFKEMTYDVVSFEVCITSILPDSGALSGGKPGPVQNRADLNAYPWDDLPQMFIDFAFPHFEALVRNLPPGIKAVGGIGNGVFELAEDLVGLEFLPYMQVDDPDLYHDLYAKIGDLMIAVWSPFLQRFGDFFVACRFGDDLGFKSSLLTNPATVRSHILPQYKKVIGLIKSFGKPFLWHSCGNIFEIMEDVIALGIDAKHSNEDAIAPFDEWISRYGDRIGLLGGFDMDFLCSSTPDEVFERVYEDGRRFRQTARGYALGSGNSIPDYVPVENYLAMIEAAKKIRTAEE